MGNKVLRVLQMIGSLDIGGSQAMIMNIYRNIDKEKIQFDFIIDHTQHMYYEEEIRKLGGKIFIMPTFIGSNIVEVLSSWKKFFKEHPEYKILHSHVRSYASLYIPIAKKYGLKTVIHSHSTSNGKGIKAFVKKILQYPLRFQADYLMACSKESGEWLYGRKACLKHNFKLLSNAIDIERYKFNLQIRNQYRKQFRVDDKFVVGHVGRLHESKNHMYLIDIFNELVKQNKDAVLVLAGDGELREKIESKISELGIENNTILVGSRMDIHNIYQMFDVFVFPSLWEGLPLSVVEAQTIGLPCYISSNITKEVVISELVEMISISNEPQCWAYKIEKAICDREKGYESVKNSKFNIQNQIKDLEQFYLELQ